MTLVNHYAYAIIRSIMVKSHYVHYLLIIIILVISSTLIMYLKSDW